MKHFEDLWEEAEKLALEQFNNKNLLDDNMVIDSIKLNLDNLKHGNLNEKAELIGAILFDLALLSGRLNINVYAALKNWTNETKIEELEDPEDS